MNIEELNSCFDSVTPTKEQKDKILAGIMSAKNEPVKVVKLNKYKYFSAAAAVVAIGVFAAVYSNIGVDDVTAPVNVIHTADEAKTETYAVNTVEPESETKPVTESVTEPEIVNIPETNTEEVVPDTAENKGVFDEFSEAYKDITENVVEDVPAVAMYTGEDNTRSTPVPTEGDDFEYNSAESDDSSAIYSYGSGGGSGGGGGGSSAVLSKALGINEVMNHSVYAEMMPTIYADKFNFHTATEYYNRLKVTFKNEQGNYMTLSVFKEGEYNFYEQVLKPEEIKNIKPEGHMNFAVKCGEYYVVYNVETYDSSAVYDMVISSAYFNN